MRIIDLDANDTDSQTGIETLWQGNAALRVRPAPSFIFGPGKERLNHDEARDPIMVPPYAVWGFHDALVCGHGLVTVGDAILGGHRFPGVVGLEQASPRALGQAPGAFLASQDQATARTVRGDVVLLCRPGDNIYGHWLIDIFPALWAAVTLARLPKVKVLVNKNTPQYVLSWLEAAGIERERIVPHDPGGTPIRVERLIYAPSPRWRDFFDDGFRSFRDWFASLFADASRNTVAPMETSSRRLFISRSGTNSPYRNLVNREWVENSFSKAGFTIYRPETQTLAEQILMFKQAEIIAGEAGSGLHNSIFGNERLLTVEVTSNKRLSPTQGGLGQVMGQETAYLLGEAIDRAGMSFLAEFIVDRDDLAECLQYIKLDSEHRHLS